MSDTPKLHCWMGRSEDAEKRFGHGSMQWARAIVKDGTCMLPRDHKGKHRFTDDSKINVSFRSEP